MLAGSANLMCTGVPDPREWTFRDRSGISYKVNLSDGQSNLELPVSEASVFSVFKPFERYNVTFEISQVADDNRITTRCRVVDAKPVAKK